jgi:hypothetical protein
MFKTPLAKWALAAMLAVPAVPMFGKTVHRHLTVHKTTHTPLISMSAHHRRTLTHTTTHHVTYSSRHKTLTHRTTTTHHLTHTTTVRHTSLKSSNGSSQRFKVHVTKMPPTIDGINA